MMYIIDSICCVLLPIWTTGRVAAALGDLIEILNPITPSPHHPAPPQGSPPECAPGSAGSSGTVRRTGSWPAHCSPHYTCCQSLQYELTCQIMLKSNKTGKLI